jgi:putative phosphoserine phosphatase/1-acylglycerol-3-phosphate O-acyltransferase
MSGLQARIAEVERGPAGPAVGAFFDFDGTLIAGYSATVFYLDRLLKRQVSPRELASTLIAGADMSLRGADITGLMRIAAQAMAGHSEDELTELGQRLFLQRIAGMVYPEARALVRAHQRAGHTLVLASSATRYQAGPLAGDLGFEHLLCSQVEVERGIITGNLLGPVLWGEGKARAVRDLAARCGLDLGASYGYANGDEDVPFLETVGRPRPLNPQDGLRRTAMLRGWPVVRFAGRGRPGAEQLLRTGAALTGLGAAAAVGIGIGLLNGSRRQAANLATSVGSDIALALAGVQLRVSGEEHLWTQRPAVFVFNHQSSMDVPIVANLVRRDLTAVAKKEASRDPRFAILGHVARVAYVDRGNSQQARAALAPAVDRLREGISLAIAPEGTRSVTPRLGRFRKGAFHVAMQAGVPIVPIVIRNAGDVMWRGSLLVRPGTVDITVLPPIPTRDWRVEDLPGHVADLERRYRETLDDWPDGRRELSGRARRPPQAPVVVEVEPPGGNGAAAPVRRRATRSPRRASSRSAGARASSSD